LLLLLLQMENAFELSPNFSREASAIIQRHSLSAWRRRRRRRRCVKGRLLNEAKSEKMAKKKQKNGMLDISFMLGSLT